MRKAADQRKLRILQLQTLSDPVRQRILELLKCCGRCSCEQVAPRNPGLCVCDLQAALGLRQPTITHHVRRLRDVGLIETRKIGRWLYCCRKEKILDNLAEWLRAM